ncbi:hypothetical protein FBU59_006905 [Linderina macrospora]|uniref:Uncharacterized protein n=1 Tax=Linderina macrospora TaxID=4868 RepID=A0ACC1IYJ9_9FUNG|nr:hypothetical protein FBU59_006905 [Linderina macrospora]
MTSTFGDKFYDVSAGDNASAGDDAAVVPSQVASAPSAQPDLTGAPVKYLEHLLTTRQSLSRNYLDVLPGAYNVLLADRVRRESSDVLDEKTIETNATSLMSHCATFAGIVKNIDLVCNTLDETIVHLLDQIPSSNEKAEVIRNNEDYFVHLLSIHIDKFDSYQLAADPETYLDAFVPSFIIDAPTDQLNWRTFLASYGSPFIRNFVIRALKGVQGISIDSLTHTALDLGSVW